MWLRMEENERKTVNSEKQDLSSRLKDYIKNLFNFSNFGIKTIFYIIIFAGLVIISLILLFMVFFVDNEILYRFVVNYFVNPIYNLGIIGIFLFVVIMGVQGLIVPLPSEIVLIATGMIWGWFLGGIMGIIGSMAAGILCYYISKWGGRPIVEKFVGEKAIILADNFIKKHGTKAIIITRFIPFIPFDVVSYTSGLVDMDVKKYAIGTLIGSIFRSFFYATLGSLLFIMEGLTLPLDFVNLPVDVITLQSNYFNGILLIILASLALMIIIYYILIKKSEKKSREKADTSTIS